MYPNLHVDFERKNILAVKMANVTKTLAPVVFINQFPKII